jgi:hypothetical protein
MAIAHRCFNCDRQLYGLMTVGAMKVCGRADCLYAALFGRVSRRPAA